MEGKRHRLVSTRKAAGFSQERLAETVGVERTTVMRWERGETRPQPWARPKLARALGIADHVLSELLGEPAEPESAGSASGPIAGEVAPLNRPVRSDASSDHTSLHAIETLRRGLNETISEHTITPASLDDWEQTVFHHGQATRNRAPSILLKDLSADLAQVRETLARCRSASALRRLTRITAQMAGLMCLTLIKMDERTAFQSWARTARLAAHESGDLLTHSWVRA